MIAYDSITNVCKTAEVEGSLHDLISPVVHLRHPRTGTSTCYLLMNGYVQELHWFKTGLSSWFIGDSVCEDGSLYLSSPIDSLFLALGLLESARMKTKEAEGKFRTLEDILSVDDFPSYAALRPMLEDSLTLICQVKEVGGDKYFRLDDRRTMAWLCCKVEQTCNALRDHGGKTTTALSDADLRVYAVGMLGEYLNPDTWHKRLCSHLKVDPEAAKQLRSNSKPEELFMSPPRAPEPSSTSKKPKTSASKRSLQPGDRKITSFFTLPR